MPANLRAWTELENKANQELLQEERIKEAEKHLMFLEREVTRARRGEMSAAEVLVDIRLAKAAYPLMPRIQSSLAFLEESLEGEDS
jgi:hypothetical protein